MEPNFDIIFMAGPQGSGKGTQGKRLAAKLDFFSWDMGAILRGIIAEHTPLGERVASITNTGQYLSDEMLIAIMKDRLLQLPKNKGLIFDGVPRRMGQAKFILDFLKTQPRKGMLTIFIDVPRDISVQRLLLRAKTEGRADDTAEAINKRLDQFEELTKPMMEYLKQETRYVQIDGRPSVDEVEKSIDAALGI